MAPTKSGLFTLVAPVFVAVFITRPAVLEEYAKQFVGSVQRANISVDTVSDQLNQAVHSSGFRFLLIYAAIAVVTYYAVKIYKAFTEPLAIYCDETKIAYLVEGPEGGKSAKQRVEDYKRWRKVGDVPPVYPNGWMSILMSHELKKKERKFLHVAGKNLAVFRGESGRSYIVDAYCAHLGANLAMGGSVHGDCIECPFHGWRYRGDDGKCVKIGYAEKVPEFAKIPTYHSCEKNQRIYFWFHAEGAEPDWEVPEVEDITNGTMKPVGFTVAEYDGHNEDVPENGSDIAHLDYLHGPRTLSGERAHFFDADWAPDPVLKHVATVSMKTKTPKLFGIIPMKSNAFKIDQIGPCFAHFGANLSGIGRMLLLITVTPVGPMRQRVVTTGFYAGGPLTFYAAKMALYEQYYQIEGDIPVWANKIYIRNALLVKEDHLINKHRRFYSRFYSENSPKYSQEDQTVDW